MYVNGPLSIRDGDNNNTLNTIQRLQPASRWPQKEVVAEFHKSALLSSPLNKQPKHVLQSITPDTGTCMHASV